MKCSIPLLAIFVAGTIAMPAATTPKCNVGEEYTDCGTACPLTCAQPEPRPCTLQCVPGCFCKRGLIRNQGFASVPISAELNEDLAPACINVWLAYMGEKLLKAS
ncbi:hypothetical protein FGADI_667 [Fusarium gaditjirri]|uniref:TIL domain-containing protein n=1 Tax=Fusarium gaditjirri TaxID=282569 RepID=A0A8H4TN85_9HYPO|nr:hypothetical protein FGADI_667 [Fusarium gaditjirri]